MRYNYFMVFYGTELYLINETYKRLVWIVGGPRINECLGKFVLVLIGPPTTNVVREKLVVVLQAVDTTDRRPLICQSLLKKL